MNTVEIVAPDYNTDIRIIADWILQIAFEHHFPIELEERELYERLKQEMAGSYQYKLLHNDHVLHMPQLP